MCVGSLTLSKVDAYDESHRVKNVKSNGCTHLGIWCTLLKHANVIVAAGGSQCLG